MIEWENWREWIKKQLEWTVNCCWPSTFWLQRSQLKNNLMVERVHWSKWVYKLSWMNCRLLTSHFLTSEISAEKWSNGRKNERNWSEWIKKQAWMLCLVSCWPATFCLQKSQLQKGFKIMWENWSKWIQTPTQAWRNWPLLLLNSRNLIRSK